MGEKVFASLSPSSGSLIIDEENNSVYLPMESNCLSL